jgi:RNase P/RNase MRP subunit p29
MSERKAERSAATRGRWYAPALGGSALALLALTWISAPGPVRADTVVLKSGEMLEGSIIDATRNTLVLQRAIGGMRQIPLREVAEVRIDLPRGQQVSGQLLSWADGVYEVRSGGEIVRIGAGKIVSRAPTEMAVGQPQSDQASRPTGPQAMRMAAAPAALPPDATAAARATPAREQMDRREPEGADRSPAAGESQVPAAYEHEGLTTAARPRPAMGADRGQSPERAEGPVARAEQSSAADHAQSSPARAEQRIATAGKDRAPTAARGQPPAVGERRAPAAPATQAAAEAQTAAADRTQSTPAEVERSLAARADRSATAGENLSQAQAKRQTTSAGPEQRMAAVGEARAPTAIQDQIPAASERRSSAPNQNPSPPAREERSVAALSRGQPPGGARGTRSLAVKASVDPAASGAENMVFRIELSQPAEQTVVLIYGTVEGTAKAGKDFEPQKGMVALAPGTKSAEVRVPLIEQPSSEGEKSFELFLAADPKVAEVVDKRVVATISSLGRSTRRRGDARAGRAYRGTGWPRGASATAASRAKAYPPAHEESAALLLVSRQTLDGSTPKWQSRPGPPASAGRSQAQVGGTLSRTQVAGEEPLQSPPSSPQASAGPARHSPTAKPQVAGELSALEDHPALSAGEIRVFIHHIADHPGVAALAERLAEHLRRQGFTVADIRPVDFTISKASVRYFFEDDRSASERLVDELGRFFEAGTSLAPDHASDFTHFLPKPRAGNVEVWLPASPLAAALPQIATRATAAEERLVPTWMTVDAGAHKVTMDVVAGFNPNNSNWNFNGYYDGDMTVVVPEGWQVEIALTDRDGEVPHSLVVMADTGADNLPLQAGREQAAFPRAYSRSPEQGISARDQDTISFKADQTGEFLWFCGVPGHGQSGMWMRFAVTDEAETPYITTTADAEPGRF